MVDDVKRPKGQRQAARTEAQVVAAATRLFLERGYTATTIEQIAAEADVGARTIYVRFGSKAALFKRVVDVAIVGDTDHVDVLGRDWAQAAQTAPTMDDRIAAWAAAERQILERTGALFAVAQQAAAVEPAVAEYWQQGRAQHRYAQGLVWQHMVADGLLPPETDLDWLVDTSSVVTAAETYLLGTRMLAWSLDGYEAWLRETLRVVASGRVAHAGARGAARPGRGA